MFWSRIWRRAPIPLLAGLLDAAEAVLAIRGVDRRKQLAALRKRLERPKR